MYTVLSVLIDCLFKAFNESAEFESADNVEITRQSSPWDVMREFLERTRIHNKARRRTTASTSSTTSVKYQLQNMDLRNRDDNLVTNSAQNADSLALNAASTVTKSQTSGASGVTPVHSDHDTDEQVWPTGATSDEIEDLDAGGTFDDVERRDRGWQKKFADRSERRSEEYQLCSDLVFAVSTILSMMFVVPFARL